MSRTLQKKLVDAMLLLTEAEPYLHDQEDLVRRIRTFLSLEKSKDDAE